MKYTFLLLALWGLIAHGQSLSDTIYYDKEWHKSSSGSFTFYRTWHKEKDLYLVTDYYRDGTMQMNGTYTSLDPEVKNGFFTYYFPSGSKKSEGEWYNSKKRGTFRFYADITGVLLSTFQYRNDKKNGPSYRYYSNGSKTVSLFEDDKLISSKSEPKINNNGLNKTNGPNADKANVDADIFNSILKKKFSELPDYLKKIQCTVSIGFEIDTDGTIFNISPILKGDKRLTDLVIQSIKEMPKLHTDNAIKNTNKSYKVLHDYLVIFPKLSVASGVMTSNTIIYSGDTSHPMNDSLIGTQSRSSALGGDMNQSDILQKYFKANFKQIPIANDERIKDIAVVVQFTINSKREMSDINLVSGTNKNLNDVVIKLTKQYPYWQRSLIKEGQMSTVFTLTVTFPGCSISVTEHAKPD